jgi:hypothetical protein
MGPVANSGVAPSAAMGEAALGPGGRSRLKVKTFIPAGLVQVSVLIDADRAGVKSWRSLDLPRALWRNGSRRQVHVG